MTYLRTFENKSTCNGYDKDYHRPRLIGHTPLQQAEHSPRVTGRRPTCLDWIYYTRERLYNIRRHCSVTKPSSATLAHLSSLAILHYRGVRAGVNIQRPITCIQKTRTSNGSSNKTQQARLGLREGVGGVGVATV